MSHISRGDIHAYLDGALGAYSEEAAKHVRKHLDECGECARLLEDEKRLREEASVILATPAVGPVELDPLEELLARAAEPEGRERADGADGPERRGRVQPSLVNRLYTLRWAATVVVSLGAGWLAPKRGVLYVHCLGQPVRKRLLNCWIAKKVFFIEWVLFSQCL